MLNQHIKTYLIQKIAVLVLFFIFSHGASGQTLIQKEIVLEKDTIVLDSISIDPHSFSLRVNGMEVSNNEYSLLPLSGILIWETTNRPTKVEVTYRRLSINFNENYKRKDTLLFSNENTINHRLYSVKNGNQNIFNTGGVRKSGSISRGVLFGNNQNLSLNSNLNLQLEGKISDDLSIRASVSDNNLPIQPDGNTQQLQDFDQVYIQLFGSSWKLTAGDFWLQRKNDYFLKYYKRAQGLSYFTSASKNSSTRVSAAISKGKFARNIIQGIEGNQGPYKLTGAESEPFIVVLSGTEQVFIDGKLLKRGQENDYVINYNTAEVTFTANNMITKDRRIIVTFQYSDKNYARTVFAVDHDFIWNSWNFSLSAYSEQDSKNQPLQQQLSPESKLALANAGDNTLLAVSQSADSVGYNQNMLLYKRVDSLGYSPVYVFSTNPDSAYYQVFFSNVGQSNGDYIKGNYTTFGQSYEWVAPDTINGLIYHNGNYAPVKQLISPQKRQFLSGEAKRKFKNSEFIVNTAYTNYDKNTFSPLDKNDNDGYSGRVAYNYNKKMRDTTWRFQSKTSAEYLSTNFNYINWFRSAEFDRDWNVRNKGYKGEQYLASEEIVLKKSKKGNINVGSKYYQIGNDFSGINSSLVTKWNGFFNVDIDGSYLMANAESKSDFLRHKATITKKIGKIRVGYTDIHEMNTYKIGDSLLSNSYQFYDYKFYIENQDTVHNKYQIFVRHRINQFGKNNRLSMSDRGRSFGGMIYLNQNKNNLFKLVSTYRELRIVDTLLTTQKPDQNILNRIDHQLKLLKGALSFSTFYEVGSGLELQKQFVYLEVPAGQGVYTWVDYNNNNVKEINEFEIASYPDQATYIRVFTPSNTYVKSYYNQFSESITINPRYILKKKTSFVNFVNRFSFQGAYRSDKKTSNNDFQEIFSPFSTTIQDSLLQSANSSFRTSFFFNRTNPKYGFDYTYQEFLNKQLLVNGFDAKKKDEHALKLRWNITRKYTLQGKLAEEYKVNLSDYAPSRNYSFNNQITQFKISLQPSTAARFTAGVEYKEKKNLPVYGGQRAYVTNFSVEAKINQLKKGSITGSLNYIMINYIGELNNSVSYQMLESLKPGNNITWNLNVTKTLANNLQLSINYIGRKTAENKIIHTGGMQVRAFF